ncbi:MAG: hypothetical protein M0T84_14505 [Betaproteobacteria bacterium]|nr:hypothetical protein [Betaproteobacteria bacterium]
MDYVAISLAFVNVVLSVIRLWRTLKSRRLIAAIWLLITYFSIFLLGLAFAGPFDHVRGWHHDVVTIHARTIRYMCGYALVFNGLFALAEGGLGWILGLKPSRVAWQIDRNKPGLGVAGLVFLGMMLAGAASYWTEMRGLGYHNYVQYDHSSWSQVFLWASSPFITLSALQRRYLRAALATIPFLVFAVYLDVRSFALLSLVPAAIVFYFQTLADRKNFMMLLARSLVVFFLLVGVSAVVMHKKAEDMSAPGARGLPDAGLVYGMGIAFQMTDEVGVHTGYNSLTKYAYNLVNPFLRLFKYKPPKIEDTPVYIARLMEGIPAGWPIYFHFPALWYSDAYVSFGASGVVLGLLWGVVLSAWERLMLGRPELLGLLLPFYTWHGYMLVRGATAIAAVPFMYSAYVALAVGGVFLLSAKLLGGGRSAAQAAYWPEDVTEVPPP